MLLQYVGVYDARKQVLTSFVVVSCDALVHFSKRYQALGRDSDKALCISLVKAILPWTLSYLGSIRSLSQYAVRHSGVSFALFVGSILVLYPYMAHGIAAVLSCLAVR